MLAVDSHGLACKGAEDLDFCPSSAIFIPAV